MRDRKSTRGDVLGAGTAGLIVVVFCLLLLWRDPLVFWNDDYQLSILPVFADVARSWGGGEWPLLSPYSWVCGNLAGEFQYGTFSIFVNAAVVLIWKLPLTFAQQAAALSITHLFVLAAGAFLLARDRNFSFSLSLFVALVAALNGWIICWGATDWFGALGAFAWLPWAWWALERALKVAPASSRCSKEDHRQDADAASTSAPTPNNSPSTTETSQTSHHKLLTMHRKQLMIRVLWPALFVYLVITGGFPYTVVMLALLIAWLSVRSLIETKSFWSIAPMLFGVALGVGLSAPAWLALFDYVRGSAREMQPASSHWQWIVPPAALPGLILPCWTVNWADFSTRYLPHAGTELSCGLVAPVALVSGFIWRPRLLISRLRWELILLVVVLVAAMLPTAGVFRWSFRWLPLFHLVLAICAAEALHLRSESSTPAAAVLILTGLTIAMAILKTEGAYAFPLTWILLQLAVVWTLLEFFARDIGWRAWMPACVTFATFLVTYLCIPPNCGVPKYNLSAGLTRPAPLDPQRLYLSVYPAAEHTYRVEAKPGPVGQILRPGSTSMWAALRFINGYSPIVPSGVGREFKFAIHGEIDPDMGRYLLSNQAGTDGQLAALGVDGITVAREIEASPVPESEWQLVGSTEEGRVFHRRGPPFAPVRSVTSSIGSRPDQQFAAATISDIANSRNRVEANIAVAAGDAPALLTFSRPFFRGYVARLNDVDVRVRSYRDLFPIVELSPGSNGRLVLSYRPAWLIWGSAVSLLSAAVFLGGLGFAARRWFTG